MPTEDPEPYQEEHRSSYNDFAVETATVRMLPDERNPEKILIEGPCPCCRHEMAFQARVVAYRDVNWAPLRDRLLDKVIRDVVSKIKKRSVTVYCRCGEYHPGAPPDRHGCGRYWTLNVEWGD
jgi:hypothetical protein